MNNQYKSVTHTIDLAQKPLQRKIYKRIIYSVIAVIALANTAMPTAMACGPLAGIRPECNPMFAASLQLATLPGQSQNILAQFQQANPGIYKPNIFGQSVVSNAYQVYGPLTFLGSPFARFQQENAFNIMNNTINNGLATGVFPYLNAIGLNLFGQGY